ncbi:MAG: nucleotidyltransferase family protein [Verrucomicrobiota bacterium]|nr:nucleotidyltransferase family protein [Verrucomicrobiota bacterium]
MNNTQGSADFGPALRAIVLCGGLGTRLRAVVSDRPKSMALIGNVPFLQLLLQELRGQGVQDVILGTGYRADQIEKFFGSGESVGLRLHYSEEDAPLGTGGALKLAEELLSDPVVVMNGDSYVDWSLAAMADMFFQTKADIVMILQEVPDVGRYGSVTIDADGRVAEFVEKGSRTGAGLINAGIYLLRKEIVSDLERGSAISLERDVFPKFLGKKFYGLISRGVFIDIGVPADLERAQTVLGPL